MPEKSERKKKLMRLAILVNEFLERSVDIESLKKNPGETDRLRRILENNLWQGQIDPHDSDWSFESVEQDNALDSPELYTEGELIHENALQGVRSLMFFHDLLTSGFWKSFREEVRHQQSMAGPIECPEGYFFGDVPVIRDAFFELSVPKTVRLRGNFEGDQIHFYTSSIQAIPLLIDLIEGQPLDIFKFCKEKKCGRVFVLTSKHKREFCCANCASKNNQQAKRERDREGFNKYHREYYKRTK